MGMLGIIELVASIPELAPMLLPLYLGIAFTICSIDERNKEKG